MDPPAAGIGQEPDQPGDAALAAVVHDQFAHACGKQCDGDRAPRASGADEQNACALGLRPGIDLSLHEGPTVKHVAMPRAVRISAASR